MILQSPRGTPWTGSRSAISFAVTTLTPVHSAVTCTMRFTSIPTCGFVLISSVVSILILRLTSLVTLLVLDPISPFYLFFLCYQFQYFTSLLYDAYLHILSLCEILTQKETVKWWSVPCWAFKIWLISHQQKNQQTRTKWFVTCSRSFSLILSTDTDMVQNPYCACMRISIPFHALGHTMLPSLFILKQKTSGYLLICSSPVFQFWYLIIRFVQLWF